MDKELAYIIILPATALLWMLGGTYHKAYRRYVIPFLVFLPMMIWFHIDIWRIILTTLLTCGAYHIGYGDDEPMWKNILVALSYSVSTLALGFTYWQIIIPVLFLLTMVLSWKHKLTWKACEGIIGFSIGLIIATLLGG